MNPNSKTLGIFAMSVLLLAVMVSGASATTTSFSFSHANQSQSISHDNLGLVNITGYTPIPEAKVNSQSFGTFSVSNTTSALNVTLTKIESENSYYGLSGSVKFNVTGYVNSTTKINVPVTLSYVRSFCDYGDLNDSKLSMDVSVDNLGQGDSTNWNSLDTVKVEVTVYNDNNYDLNNMNLELGLINKETGQNIASNKLDWISGDNNKVSLDTISEGDSITYTFEFKVDPKIVSSGNLGSGDYYLMLKAYQGSQNQVCIDHSSDFESPLSFDFGSDVYIKSADYNHAVVIDQSSLPVSTSASCGQQVSLDPTIYNIGGSGNSYSKNQMLVVMYSTLNGGIRQNETVYGDLNAGNSVQLTTPFTFKVPVNSTETSYPVYFTIYYGYNENSGTYFGHYNKMSSDTFSTNLVVKGNCVYATPATTQVQASLQSGGKAGEPLVIQAAVTNTGSKTVSYSFGLEGYNSWATVSGINPSNITLAPGQSQNVMLNMNVNKDASGGDKQFNLDVYSNGYLITQQPLSLTVTQSFWNSITGNVTLGSNAGLWIFNIVLVLAIIIVLVVVLVRRRK